MTSALPARCLAVAMSALCLWAFSFSLTQASDRQASQHYKKGIKLLEEEKWEAAFQELKAAVEERPRSGTIRIGSFLEPYFPYLRLGQAAKGKGDFTEAARYFKMEESEGKIQSDSAHWQRLVRESGETTGQPSPPSAEKPAPGAQPGPQAPPVPGPTSSESPEVLLGETRTALEELKAFEGRQEAALTPAQRQKLDSLRQALESALGNPDPARLKDAGGKALWELAELRLVMANALLKERGAFMSQEKERELRDLSKRFREAYSGGDGAALQQLTPTLDDLATQVRDQSEQAFAAVRTAFTRAAAGDNAQAIEALEGALASQGDNPALRLILARFYFDGALEQGTAESDNLKRAREEAAQAFRLRPGLSFPERYFPPSFLALVREAKRTL